MFSILPPGFAERLEPLFFLGMVEIRQMLYNIFEEEYELMGSICIRGGRMEMMFG